MRKAAGEQHMAKKADGNFVTHPPKASKRKGGEVEQNRSCKKLNQNEIPLEKMSILTTKVK